MAPDIGGYDVSVDWPKIGPSLLISIRLILAIRTARKVAASNAQFSTTELDAEIEYSAHLAGRVLAILAKNSPSIFRQKEEPWFPSGRR